MILPLFLLAYHWYFEGGTRKAFAIDMIGYGAAALLVAGGRYAVLGAFGPQEAHQFFYGIPWPATALTMAKAIAYYWKIVLWPADLQMNYDFSDFPVAASLLDARVAASLLFLAAVIALARWLYRRDRTLSFFVLWPFIALLPVMNILVPSGVLIAVRLLYLPMAGYSVVLAAGIALLGPLLARIWGDEHGAARERALLIAVCSSVVLLAVMTLDRNRDFRDSETLFRKDLLLSPDNTLSMRFLAPELPPDEAEALLTRALRLRPDDSLFLSMLGEVYEGRGDHAAAEALQRRSLAIESTYRAHKQLGIVLSSTGRLREAEDEFRKVVELKPYWSDAYEDLAINQYRQGRREEARELLQKALQLNPGSAGAYNLIGVAYKDGGDFPRAAAAFQRSIALSRQADEVPPQLYEAMFNLADAYEKYDPEAAMRAWTDYLRAAEAAPAEQTWVAEAKTRIAALSRARQDR